MFLISFFSVGEDLLLGKNDEGAKKEQAEFSTNSERFKLISAFFALMQSKLL